MSVSRERPIIFSAPMVRAILEGKKSQTRRIAKPRVNPSLLEPGTWSDEYVLHPGNREWLMRDCPYGAPGDRLWVREAFIHEPAEYLPEASTSIPYRPASTVYRADCAGDTRGHGWSSPIHMPRWASRITLEVTGVRVERLQAISEADAHAEGIDGEQLFRAQGYSPSAYQRLWESINGLGSWDANPLVWVLAFRRLTP